MRSDAVKSSPTHVPQETRHRIKGRGGKRRGRVCGGFFLHEARLEKAWTSIDKSFERVYSIRGRITSLILKN